MSLSEDNIRAIARQYTEPEHQAEGLIHWDTKPRAHGDPVLVGRSEQLMPFDGYYVFIDLQPEANWGHAARCLLISSDGIEVRTRDVQFPPHLGFYPDSYSTLRLD